MISGYRHAFYNRFFTAYTFMLSFLIGIALALQRHVVGEHGNDLLIAGIAKLHAEQSAYCGGGVRAHKQSAQILFHRAYSTVKAVRNAFVNTADGARRILGIQFQAHAKLVEAF